MAKKKEKENLRPLSREQLAIGNAKLFDFLDKQNFKNVDEINAFMEKNVMGKRIDEIIPAKKGRKSNVEKSDDLIYEAYSCSPGKGKKLAAEALKLNRNNVNAIIYLADFEEDITKSIMMYAEATDIAANLLGPDCFEQNKGHFWLKNETRPYMTAKYNFAICLANLGNKEEAVVEYNELLELNPNDNQGVRYYLAAILFELKKYAEYYKLYKEFEDENSTFWLFNYALYLFITEGESPNAYKALLAANNSNKHVLKYMTAQEEIKINRPGMYSPGDENEASYYLMDNIYNWIECPGSLDWIFNFLDRVKKLN